MGRAGARLITALLGASVLGIAAPVVAHADTTVNCEPYGPGTPDIGVARIVYRTAVDLGASPKVLLSAFEAALVESNMNNCANGDLDSVGVFQQRTSWGTFEQRTNVAYATTSFVTRAIAKQDSYSTAGRLAQAVQISAFPARYDQRQAAAEALLALAAAGQSSVPATQTTQVESLSVVEGGYISYQGHSYRIVGGAPVVVTDWDHLGGRPAGLLAVTAAQWADLPTQPADGTYLRAVAPGSQAHGSVYRVAGGAPIFVPEWSALGGDPGTTLDVDLAAVSHAGQSGIYAHLRHRPAEGTVLRAAGQTYVVRSGAPVASAASANAVEVHPDAIANAGGTGVWAHLAAPPSSAGHTAARSAQPARVSYLRLSFPGARTARLTWKAPALASSYKVRVSKANSARKWSDWTTVTEPAAQFSKLRKHATYRIQVTPIGTGGSGPTRTLKFVQKR